MNEEILSPSEGSPIKSPETPAVPQDSPVLKSEQTSTETSPNKHLPLGLFSKERLKPNKNPHLNQLKSPLPNGARSKVAPSPKLAKFLKRGVVRGKIVKMGYFQEQGLEVFLDKLKA